MFGEIWSNETYSQTVMYVLGGIITLAAILAPFKSRHPGFIAAWASLKSWFFAAPLLFFVFGLPAPWPLVGVTIATTFCAKEFFQLTGMYHKTVFVWIVYIGIWANTLSTYYSLEGLYDQMPMIVMAFILLIPIIFNTYKNMIQYMALSLINFMFMGWGLLHIAKIYQFPEGPFHLIYMILLTEVCDNVTLASSRIFNKHRLVSQITHRRTVEGLGIAFVLTMALAYGLRTMVTHQYDYYWMVAGFVAFFGSSIADLAITVIRKDLGVKDMGAFIWGRGGILDVMDRWIVVAPLYFYTIIYVSRWLQ
ncbi:MAG: phosphatidate cytidylyltransferase [Bdellovibrionales bacterium]